MAHAVDVALEFFVCVYWHVAHEVVVRTCVAEKVVSAVFCTCRCMQQMLQHVVLQRFRFGEMTFQLVLSGNERIAYDAC